MMECMDEFVGLAVGVGIFGVVTMVTSLWFISFFSPVRHIMVGITTFKGEDYLSLHVTVHAPDQSISFLADNINFVCGQCAIRIINQKDFAKPMMKSKCTSCAPSLLPYSFLITLSLFWHSLIFYYIQFARRFRIWL